MNQEDLKQKLQELELEKTKYLDGWKRAQADLLNYKKDELKRMYFFAQAAKEELLKELLTVLDHFDHAEKSVSSQDKEKDVIKGFLQIKKDLEKFFKDQGIERMEVLGRKFDPKLHEAVQAANEDGKEPGLIIEEISAGYIKNNELFRPAKVKVTK